MHVPETYNGTSRSDALNSRSRGHAFRIRLYVLPISDESDLLSVGRDQAKPTENIERRNSFD